MPRGADDVRDDERVGDVLREVRSRREELRVLMVELERAAAAPPGRKVGPWCESVFHVLAAMQSAFSEHIALNEEPGGLFEQILETAPELASAVDRLEHEHLTIAHELAVLMERLAVAPNFLEPEAEVAEVYAAILQLLGRLARHRRYGADVLHDAYGIVLNSR